MPTGNRNTQIPGCGTHHIAVQTSDWDTVLRLYRDVLGMPVIARFGTPEREIVLVDAGDGSHIELFQPTAGPPKTRATSQDDTIFHFALATTDARAALEHVCAAGYEVTVEPTDVALDTLDVTVAFFKGPSGEVIEFFQVR